MMNQIARPPAPELDLDEGGSAVPYSRLITAVIWISRTKMVEKIWKTNENAPKHNESGIASCQVAIRNQPKSRTEVPIRNAVDLGELFAIYMRIFLVFDRTQISENETLQVKMSALPLLPN